SYAGSPFCATGTANVTQTGQGGGTYTSTAGLSINSATGQLNLATSTAGTYTVTYSFTNGTCSNTTTTSVTVTAVPSVAISYAGSPFCQSVATPQAVTQSGGVGAYAGGTYTASPAGLSIDGPTGNVTPSLSTPGTYTVTYTIPASGGCPSVLETTTVTVNPTPTVVITNPAAVCNPTTVDLTAASVTAGSTSGLTFTYWTDAAATIALATPNAVGTAGTYYIKGTTAAGCSDIQPVTVTINSGPTSAVLSGDNTICKGVSTNLIITITGGASPYSFTVDNSVGNITGYISANPISVTPLTNTVYSIVGNVTDANGCTVAGSGTATITVNTPATPTLTGPVNACQGSTVNYATDAGMTNYNWVLSAGGSITSNNGDNIDVTWNTAGAQTVSVNYQDLNSCTTTTTVLNVSVANLVVTPTITDNTNCPPSYNGAISLAISGSVGVLSFSWTSVGGFTSAAQNITNLKPDNYSLTVTDPVSGCTVTYTGLIVNDNPPTITATLTASTDNNKCVAPFVGALSISTTGSVGVPTFSWTGPGGYTSSSQNITGLNAGNYTVTVTDPSSGCSANQSFTVNDITPVIIPSTNPTDNTNCVAPFNGAITSSVSGGGPAYTYQWSGPSAYTATTQNISNLAPGSYDLTVTDVATGCTGTLSGTLVNNSPPTITVTSVATTNATCLGVNNGLIQVNGVTGGAAPYQYSIDNGVTFQASNTFSNIAPGNYQVVAKDNGGCVSTAYPVTITSGTTITASTGTTNATCVGTTDGAITVTTVVGGTSPYTYSDNNGTTFQASNNFTNLASGTYQVIARDNNGCQSAPASVTVGTNTTITYTATPTNASCAGINDGQIAVTAPTGGIAPYTYSDDNGVTFQASATFSLLAPGSYNVVIKDTNGCLSAASAITVGSNTTISITTVNHTDATCSGLNDGSITVAAVTGGVSPYTYSTDNGVTFQASNAFSNLAPNTYQVVVKDSNGCMSIATAVTVGSGSTITIVTSKVDATCGGNSDGSITVSSVVGGNPAYTYSSNGGITFQASNVLTGLAANTYSVVVKDNSGCLSNPVSVIINNSVSIIPNYTKTDASCAANDGSIIVNSVSGGASPYSYSINNGVTFQASTSFTSLAVGTYNLVAKDNNGCLSTAIAIVVSKPGSCGGTNCGVFTILATDTRPTCNNQNNGTITINVSGGTPNYIVTLSDPSISFNQAMSGLGPFTFVNLSPSLTYQYTVQDASGNTCTLPYSLPINSTVQASASSFVNAQCFGQPVGQATVTVTSGGTSPFAYSLDNGTTWTSFTSPVVITNLKPAPAPYSILVADDPSDPCPAQVMVTINNANPAIAMTAPTVTNASCANNDGSIQVGTVSGGVAPYTYRFDSVNYATLPSANTFSALPSGAHKFTVIDAASCSKTFTINVASPGYVNFFTQRINPSCTGSGSDGKVKVTILSSGNFDVGITTNLVAPPATFKFTGISNLSTPVTFDSLSQGQYHIVVKPNGAFCSTDSIVTIQGGPKMVAFNLTPNNFACFEKKGTLNLYSISGAPAIIYNYKIIDTLGTSVQQGTIAANATSAILNNLSNGSYKIWLYQKQAVCTDTIPSTAKKFAISGPTQVSFDTLTVKRTLSELNLATGAMTITLQNTFAPVYLLNLKMISSFVPNQTNAHNVFDSTWVNVNTSVTPVVFVASDLYAGVYKLSIADKFGCTRVDTLTISVNAKIFIPNVFTPNNDGKNDAFEILNLPNNNSIVITNRWGKQVFSGNNLPSTLLADGVTSTVVWNGGAESDGIYYYTLNAAGKVYTGWIELLHPTY
ncbi:MAG: gliding motility-associated C-terminal domain-containing protein, partial [Bacteroidetes bacterium]|nr:gliding motility-associated C-terminal domain-containing protein [Bacteroidota bacterium]